MAKKESTGKLIKKLQPIFNKYIRIRDINNPCISCGKKISFEDTDGGHFFAKSGYSGLRFDEDNCHKECRYCNRYDESHLIGYAENIRLKLGDERYNALKERANEYKKNGVRWSRIDLRYKIEYYKMKLAEYENP